MSRTFCRAVGPSENLFGGRELLSHHAAASMHEEPGAGKLPAGICAGAVGQPGGPTAIYGTRP